MEALWRRRAEEPDAPWLIDGRDGSVLRAADMDLLSRKAIGLLRSWGLRRGDRLAVVAEPEVECVVLLAGALRAGIPVVLAHPGAAPDDDAAAWGARRTVGGRGAPGLAFGDGLSDAIAGADPADPEPDLDPDAPAVLLYSSGSSGARKGVSLSWRALVDSIGRMSRATLPAPLAAAAAHLASPGVREGVPARLHTVTGFRAAVVAPLVRTSTCVLLPPDAPPDVLWAAATACDVSVLTAGPGFVAAALRRLPRDHSAVKLVILGGDRVDPAERDALADALEVTCLHAYGLTEAGGLVAVTGSTPGHTSGPETGIPLVPMRIVGPDGAPCGIGEEGFVEVRATPGVARADGTPVAPNGWLATGDLGTVDAAGRLHVRGRAARTHVTPGGEKVQLEDLEATLTRLVGEPVVVVPVDRRLVAVREGGSTPAATVRAQIDALLPRPARPSRWVQAPLARAPSGKPDLVGLAARLAAEDPGRKAPT